MKRRILVVEDSTPSRELLRDWLETEGHEVLTATDLASAHAAAEQSQPHAVLLDVQLGDEDGLTFAAWIRQQPALCHVPVIAVTAHAMVTEQERILHSGCNSLVAKPVDFRLLRAQLDRWLG